MTHKGDIPMRRRLMTICILAIVVAAIAATPAAAERSCGWISVSHIPYHVQVTHGSVSCRAARSLIKTYGEGGGTPHGGPHASQSEMYSTLPGGWICVSGAGGAHTCRLGKRADPRDLVSGIEKLEWERFH
jgi:hypothetical protein